MSDYQMIINGLSALLSYPIAQFAGDVSTSCCVHSGLQKKSIHFFLKAAPYTPFKKQSCIGRGKLFAALCQVFSHTLRDNLPPPDSKL